MICSGCVMLPRAHFCRLPADRLAQTLFAFPSIASEISSIVLVENSSKLRQTQEEKLAQRIKGKQVDLSWVDKIDDVPACKS